MSGAACPEDYRNQLRFAERGATVPQKALTRAFIREELTQGFCAVLSLPMVAGSACRMRFACIMETKGVIATLLCRDMGSPPLGTLSAENAATIHIENLTGNVAR